MPASAPMPPEDGRKRVQWRSPWVIVSAVIAVLYLTGLLDDGFLYLERRYYAPWSVGDDALTGMWEGTVQDAAGPRKMLLNIALRLTVRGNRSRRGNWIGSRHLQIDDGKIQLQGVLTVCASEAKDDRPAQYELMGWANGDGSNVRLWSAQATPAVPVTFESLSAAWRGRSLSASLTYILRGDATAQRPMSGADRNGSAVTVRKRTVPVTFAKPGTRTPASRC